MFQALLNTIVYLRRPYGMRCCKYLVLQIFSIFKTPKKPYFEMKITNLKQNSLAQFQLALWFLKKMKKRFSYHKIIKVKWLPCGDG